MVLVNRSGRRARGDNLWALMTNRVPVLPGQELVSPTARREYLRSACFSRHRSFYHLLPPPGRSRDIPEHPERLRSRNNPRGNTSPAVIFHFARLSNSLQVVLIHGRRIRERIRLVLPQR